MDASGDWRRTKATELAEAHALVREKTDKEITVRHLISVEGVMRALARRLGEDEHRWALAGLFHDLDQDQTGEDPQRHAFLAAEWLHAAGVEEPVVNAVLAHAHERYRTDLMARAVVHADAIAGLLVAAALVRPERAAGMKVSSIKKKLKEKAFAPGVNRDEVYGAEQTLGLPLDEYIAVAIEGSSRSPTTSACRRSARARRPVKFSSDCRWRAYGQARRGGQQSVRPKVRFPFRTHISLSGASKQR